jgi:hypothetical protein
LDSLFQGYEPLEGHDQIPALETCRGPGARMPQKKETMCLSSVIPLSRNRKTRKTTYFPEKKPLTMQLTLHFLGKGKIV